MCWNKNIKFKKTKIFSWLNGKGHFQGIFWTICASFFSNMCDLSVRLVSNAIPPMQITFFRLFFGTLILLPLILFKGKAIFRIQNKRWHLFRIIIGFGAMFCWIYGAGRTTLPSATIMSFVCPIFVLPLAYLFLKES